MNGKTPRDDQVVSRLGRGLGSETLTVGTKLLQEQV